MFYMPTVRPAIVFATSFTSLYALVFLVNLSYVPPCDVAYIQWAHPSHDSHPRFVRHVPPVDVADVTSTMEIASSATW